MQRKTTSLVSFLILILFLFSSQYTSGQNKEKQALANILKSLETIHNVSFSFVPTEITDVTILPPPKDISLKKVLDYLSVRTPFRYTKINDRYISITMAVGPKTDYCGILVDALTGQPLEGALITVGQNGTYIISGSDGTFFLRKELAGEYFRVNFLGYQTLSIPITNLSTECSEIKVQPTFSLLEEVFLRNFLVQGIDRNLNGSTTIATHNFGLLPGQTENDVLQMAQVIPGVESINETISTINTRGGSNDENLILWEGNRMYQTGHFFGLISAFNPNLTQNVTIYKNGTPSHYGESVSGVIDISSGDRIASQLKGGAGLDLLNTNVFLEVPFSEKMGIQVSGRKSINELFKTPVYNTYAQRIFQNSEITNISNNQQTMEVDASENFSFYDAGLKFLWDISEKDKIRVNFLTINNTLDFTETLVEMSQSKTSRLEQRSLVGGAFWERKWSRKFKTKTQLYSSYYLLEALNTDIFTNQELFQENEVLEVGAKLNTEFRLSNQLLLSSGYDFSEIGIGNTQDVNLPRFRDFDKDVLRSHIVHGSIQYQSAHKKTSVIAGARMNYFDKFKVTLIEPRLHILQKLVFGFALELSGEFKSQTATQRIDFESDFLGVEKRRWVLANNNDIPIKKSKQASLGLVFNKENWFVNVEGFYKKVTGITSKSQGFQNQFQFSNTTGDYDVKGIEFILNKKINDFSGWMSYSYNQNDYTFEAFSPMDFPNNIDVRHTAKLATSYNRNNFKLAMGVHWHSGKPFTTPVSGEAFIIQDQIPTIQFDPPNEERLPDYMRLDVSAEYLWNFSKGLDIQFNLALLNLLNKKNTLNVRYVLEVDEDTEISVNRIEEISLGFTPNLSVQVLF